MPRCRKVAHPITRSSVWPTYVNKVRLKINMKGPYMYNPLTKQCATLAGGIILLASASLVNAAPDDRFFGGQELPQRGGIAVGTPADLEDEPENYMKLDGILGDLYDIDQDGSINERDLEMMFYQLPELGGIAVGTPGDTFSGNGRGPNLGSDQFGTSTGNAMYDLNGDGRIDEFDLAAMFDLLGTDESEGDFNGDGVVNGADLELLVRAW